MTDAKRYKTLIRATLVQTTALSIGGNDPHAMADAPLSRDGQDRLILRGTGLAGAFIATARAIVGDELPPSVTAGSPDEQDRDRRALPRGTHQDRLFESVWRFYHSHLEGPPPRPEIRTGVGIRQDTGAAAHGTKFDTETIPAGTRWPFLLEIDEYRDTSNGLALSIALHTLDEWRQQHRCFLGRDVARGLGWCLLTDVLVYRLLPEDVRHWPNAEEEPLKAIEKIPAERIQQDGGAALKSECPITTRPRFIRSGTGTIHVGPERIGSGTDTPWGLDTLSLGGGEAMLRMQDDALNSAFAQLPTGKDGQPPEPDLILAWTCPRDGAAGTPRPFLPGSGLRGPLRHTLAWWERRRGDQTIIDPNTPAGIAKTRAKDRAAPDSAVDRLFGTARYSAGLLLSDAELEGEDPTRTGGAWLIEQHAEDEFTASTCGAQKFNRLALIKGVFRFHYFIEARNADELADFDRLLDTLRQLGEQRQVPIGGGQWRGHGWVRWEWQPDPSDDGAAAADDQPDGVTP